MLILKTVACHLRTPWNNDLYEQKGRDSDRKASEHLCFDSRLISQMDGYLSNSKSRLETIKVSVSSEIRTSIRSVRRESETKLTRQVTNDYDLGNEFL